jgi:hypothetical protein
VTDGDAFPLIAVHARGTGVTGSPVTICHPSQGAKLKRARCPHQCSINIWGLPCNIDLKKRRAISGGHGRRDVLGWIIVKSDSNEIGPGIGQIQAEIAKAFDCCRAESGRTGHARRANGAGEGTIQPGACDCSEVRRRDTGPGLPRGRLDAEHMSTLNGSDHPREGKGDPNCATHEEKAPRANLVPFEHYCHTGKWASFGYRVAKTGRECPS